MKLQPPFIEDRGASWILAEAMPDELSAAHLERFGGLNGLPATRVVPALRATLRAEGHELDGLSVMDGLALSSGMSTIAYAHANSMMPVLRVSTRCVYTQPYGHSADAHLNKRFGTKVPKEGGFVCLKCIEDDLKRSDLSWFHRVHHLIGVDWCVHHGDPLWQVTDAKPFGSLPHIWRKNGKLRKLDVCSPTLDAAPAFIQRFVAISVALLRLFAPLCAYQVNHAIRVRASDFFMGKSMRGLQPYLSDHIFDLAPRSWLHAHVPTLAQKHKHEYIDYIDDQVCVSEPATADAYAMAMAALYPSVDQAFEEVVNQTELGTNSRPSSFSSFWQGEIWPYYLKYKGDHRAIAKALWLPLNQVTSRLLHAGLPDLTELQTDVLGATLSTFASGESIDKSCAAHGADEQAFHALIRVTCAPLVKAMESLAKRHEYSGST